MKCIVRLVEDVLNMGSRTTVDESCSEADLKYRRLQMGIRNMGIGFWPQGCPSKARTPFILPVNPSAVW